MAGSACRTAAVGPVVDAQALTEAVELLGGPLSGDLAALYHLRVPATGALRLAVSAAGGAGRMTVSEPFGAAVSITSWATDEPSSFYDLREGCRLGATDVSAVFGVAAMPMPEAVRLLGGRLPAVGADRILTRGDDGLVEISGSGWRVRVAVAPSPWRVTSVEEVTRGGEPGWRIRLDDHSGSVPGTIRIDGPDRGWAELELIRLQWDTGLDLAPLPDLPACGVGPDRLP